MLDICYVIGDLLCCVIQVIPNYSTRSDYEKMYAIGVTQFGQMTAGSFCYIGPQGIVHGTVLTLLNAGRKYLNAADLRGKVFVTAGLGGMSGAQPKAAVITGAVGICAEVGTAIWLHAPFWLQRADACTALAVVAWIQISREAAEKRHSQGWVDEITDDLSECLTLAASAAKEGRGTSIAYVGNVVDLWERIAEQGIGSADDGSFVYPELGSDQTSCHVPFTGGYYPVGLSYEESQRMMAEQVTASRPS